jgi:hypothetical protein
MVGRWGVPALVHQAGRRMKVARLADLALGLKVRQGAKGIFGPWEDRPQVVERPGQSRDSLRLDAGNKVRPVGPVVRAAAAETAWEMQPERRDVRQREPMGARQLAQLVRPVSTLQALARLRQQVELLPEQVRRERLAAGAQSPASRRFRLVRALEQPLCRQLPARPR